MLLLQSKNMHTGAGENISGKQCKNISEEAQTLLNNTLPMEVSFNTIILNQVIETEMMGFLQNHDNLCIVIFNHETC